MSDDLDLLWTGPDDAATTLVLAHGAGAPMDSGFMNQMADGLAAREIRVARFEFPYMQERRRSGGRKPPDRGPKLIACWKSVVTSLGGGSELFIGGKSMGGRIASMIADEVGARGLVCLGYPFHPPGKPDRLRVDHLQPLGTPTLIVQGSRDALGNREEIRGYDLSRNIRVHYLEDGDHSFKPRKASGRSLEQNMAEAIEAVAGFVGG